MKSTGRKTAIVFACFVAIALVAVACGGGSKIKPKAWTVSLVKTNTPASIEVDLIGITELEIPAWEAYSIDKYWTKDDPRRRDADKVTRRLGVGESETLDANEAVWERWLSRGANHMVVIARLPGRSEPGPGDPRRLVISLDRRKWKGRTLELEVRESQIRLLTPPK